jgi:hypothetical protein
MLRRFADLLTFHSMIYHNITSNTNTVDRPRHYNIFTYLTLYFSLEYRVAQATITINIHCDRAASKPLVTLESEEFGSYTFRQQYRCVIKLALFLVWIIEML